MVLPKIGGRYQMKLNYTMKSNGMYILSGRDFDDIATLVLTEYQPNALEWP